MNLVKWNPLKELEDVSNRLNSLFGRLPVRADTAQEKVTDWVPIVDVSENDAAYLIKGEIPGVKKDDVKVTIEDGMLTMRGERKQEKEDKGEKYHRIERSYGSFVRSFRLPEDADETGIKAEFKDGLISVTLPKTEKAKSKPKEIEVTVA